MSSIIMVTSWHHSFVLISCGIPIDCRVAALQLELEMKQLQKGQLCSHDAHCLMVNKLSIRLGTLFHWM